MRSRSPLTRGRGSKPDSVEHPGSESASPLTRGRGSKPRKQPSRHALPRSPLTRGRGSKQLTRPAMRRRRASPLTRGRGSKRFRARGGLADPASPLTRGRGSKLAIVGVSSWIIGRPSRGGVDRNFRQCRASARANVAPHAGAWIETSPTSCWLMAQRVAPHAGAWIETPCRRDAATGSQSPLTRGRGSKHAQLLARRYIGASPLTRGRGSKRECGGHWLSPLCRPSRGGVDRNASDTDLYLRLYVAPHAGAWIETHG